jgi:serine/threonine protein kinase
MAAVTFYPKEMELLPQLSEKIKQDSFIKAGEEYFEQSAHDIADLQRGWGLPCLVLEYGECSLADYMSRGLLPLIELKATFEALIRPVLVLHGKRLAHCGLQPESFRLYDGVNWRLATADSITPFGEPMPAKCPICYAAPEAVRPLRHRGGVQAAASALLSMAPAAASLDVWSLGVLLWQFFSQQPLFCSEHEAFEMATATVGQLEPSLGCVTDLQARHLLHKMLQREPRERIDSHKIAKHSYLTGGLDEVELESTFGPMQKGQLFLRNLLLQMAGSPGGR